MNHISFTQEVLKELLIQAPVLFAGTVGLVIAIGFWRKAPAASFWCAVAFILALSASALTIYASLARNDFVNGVVVLVLRAVTYILFLVGVYAGRANPAVPPSDPQPTLWQPVVELFRARPWLKGLFRVAFVSTFLLVLIWSILTSFLMTETFVGSARVQLRMDAAAIADADFDDDVVEVLDSRQVRTQCELIQSEVILRKVVEDGNLNQRWGAKLQEGEPLPTARTIQILSSAIFVQPVRHSYIIGIRVYRDSAEEAADLANAVATCYCAYLEEMRKGPSRGAVKGRTVLAEVVDSATPNLRPVSPNRQLDMVLGIWKAIWLGILIGVFVVWISIKFEKRQSALHGSKEGKGFGQEWVSAQNSLGATLRDQARRSDGVEALRLLDEAATAYRAVLDAGTRDQFPQGWAMAQNNLGVLLRDRAEWSQPHAATGLLQAAVAAHRAALEVYTREQHPRSWATTLNNLGVALRDQARRSQGAEATRLLIEAVAACRAAVEILEPV